MPRAKKTDETAEERNDQVTGPLDDSDDLHQGWTAQSGEPLPVPTPHDDHQIYVPQRMSGVGQPDQYTDSKGLSVLHNEKDGARSDGNSGAAFASSSDNVPSDASLKGTGIVDAYVANGDPGPQQVPGGNTSDATIHEAPSPVPAKKAAARKTAQSKNSSEDDGK